jgi:hypothetical protein
MKLIYVWLFCSFNPKNKICSSAAEKLSSWKKWLDLGKLAPYFPQICEFKTRQ